MAGWLGRALLRRQGLGERLDFAGGVWRKAGGRRGETVSLRHAKILDAVWGQRSNFLGARTDCPQRDERLNATQAAFVREGATRDLASTASGCRSLELGSA